MKNLEHGVMDDGHLEKGVFEGADLDEGTFHLSTPKETLDNNPQLDPTSNPCEEVDNDLPSLPRSEEV